MSTRIPVGPQHPSLIEPEHLDVKVDGETITGVDVHLGYIHRGIEGLMQKKTYQQNLYLAERICGICSGIHTLTYSESVESLLGLEVPERAKYIRTIIVEFERLHSHYLWLGVVAYEIGLDTAFQISWRDREIVLELLEKITGNRINYAMNTIGGVRRDITKEMQKETLQGIDALWEKTKYYKDVFLKDSIVRARTKSVGVLNKRDAARYSVAGPLARASSIDFDVRTTNYAAYADVKWKPVVRHGCDINSRLDVRIEEVFESLSIIRQCIEKMPEGALKNVAAPSVPAGETIMRTEAPRGELFYYMRSNGTTMPERVKIRPPTYANLLALKPMLIGSELADLPVIVASIDPCFSCAERVGVIKEGTNKKEIFDGQRLRRMNDAP